MSVRSGGRRRVLCSRIANVTQLDLEAKKLKPVALSAPRCGSDQHSPDRRTAKCCVCQFHVSSGGRLRYSQWGAKQPQMSDRTLTLPNAAKPLTVALLRRHPELDQSGPI